MRTTILISMFLVFIGGCYGTNRANLTKLQIGNSKEEVRKVMGEPYKVEASKNMEIWFYQTGIRETAQSTYNKVLTPLAFEEGKLASWGSQFVEDVDKYEVRIR